MVLLFSAGIFPIIYNVFTSFMWHYLLFRWTCILAFTQIAELCFGLVIDVLLIGIWVCAMRFSHLPHWFSILDYFKTGEAQVALIIKLSHSYPDPMDRRPCFNSNSFPYYLSLFHVINYIPANWNVPAIQYYLQYMYDIYSTYTIFTIFYHSSRFISMKS